MKPPSCYFITYQKSFRNPSSSMPWDYVCRMEDKSGVRFMRSLSNSIVCQILLYVISSTSSPIISLPVGRGHGFMFSVLFVLVTYTHKNNWESVARTLCRPLPIGLCLRGALQSPWAELGAGLVWSRTCRPTEQIWHMELRSYAWQPPQKWPDVR